MVPLPLTALPVELQHSIECVHKPSSPPASISHCIDLLRLLGHVLHFHATDTYRTKESFNLSVASCNFHLQGKHVLTEKKREDQNNRLLFSVIPDHG